MRLNIWKASTLTLAAALALVVGNDAINIARAAGDPQVQSAMQLLEQAKVQLDKTSVDAGGHRNKAIEHISEALVEVKAILAAADKPKTERVNAPKKPGDAPEKPKTERVTKPK